MCPPEKICQSLTPRTSGCDHGPRSSMTGVLIRREDSDTHTHTHRGRTPHEDEGRDRGHATTIGSRPAETRGEAQSRPPSEPPEGANPANHADLKLQASRRERINFCCVSHPASGTLLFSPSRCTQLVQEGLASRKIHAQTHPLRFTTYRVCWFRESGLQLDEKVKGLNAWLVFWLSV